MAPAADQQRGGYALPMGNNLDLRGFFGSKKEMAADVTERQNVACARQVGDTLGRCGKSLHRLSS
jgi:hypothetical protein